jgi:WD40 repeat protein
MSVGGSINNAISISHHGGQQRILLCNNDETIKVYSLPDLQRITTLMFPTAVNYASISPDGRKMVVVGDTSQVFMYNIKSDGTYERVGSMTASNDAGFSCAWNQSSEIFAVANQDGYLNIWDVRSTKKLAQISSFQVHKD